MEETKPISTAPVAPVTDPVAAPAAPEAEVEPVVEAPKTQ